MKNRGSEARRGETLVGMVIIALHGSRPIPSFKQPRTDIHMKLNHLLCLLSVPIAIALHAQDTTSAWRTNRNAIGIEVTGLLPLQDGSYSYLVQYPYTLTYRRLLGTGWLRFGVGGSGYQNKTDGNSNGQGTLSEQSSWTGAIRFGYAIPLLEHDRWLVLAGLDAVYGMNGSRSKYTYTNGEVVDDSTEGNQYGIGFAIDAQWRLSPRIALGTEMNVQALRTSSERNRVFSITTAYNDHYTSTGANVAVIPAVSLFLYTYF